MLKINPKNYTSENFISEEKMVKIVGELQKQKKKIGVCTGSFDMLHPGQITHLINAKKFCDVLVVAVARDNYSSNKNPGSGRPVYSESIRAFMVSQLKSVDYVILDNGTIEIVLPNLKPDFYIKGIDYNNLKNLNIIAEKRIVESLGGKIVFTETEKLSTTNIINHIKTRIRT